MSKFADFSILFIFCQSFKVENGLYRVSSRFWVQGIVRFTWVSTLPTHTCWTLKEREAKRISSLVLCSAFYLLFFLSAVSDFSDNMIYLSFSFRSLIMARNSGTELKFCWLSNYCSGCKVLKDLDHLVYLTFDFFFGIRNYFLQF